MVKMSNKSQNSLLINETFIIDQSVHSEWIKWFVDLYITEIKNTDLVKDILLSKIQEDNPDGEAYALQFKIKTQDLDTYKNNEELIHLRSELNYKFKNKFGSFVTILDIVLD